MLGLLRLDLPDAERVLDILARHCAVARDGGCARWFLERVEQGIEEEMVFYAFDDAEARLSYALTIIEPLWQASAQELQGIHAANEELAALRAEIEARMRAAELVVEPQARGRHSALAEES